MMIEAGWRGTGARRCVVPCAWVLTASKRSPWRDGTRSNAGSTVVPYAASRVKPGPGNKPTGGNGVFDPSMFN